MGLIFILLSFISIQVGAQTQTDIFTALKSKHFFLAKEIYEAQKNSYTRQERQYIEAVLHNAFNKPAQSNVMIDALLATPTSVPDSIALLLYRTRSDNFVKLFEYEKAAKAIETILERYTTLLESQEQNDLKNSHLIWTKLKDVPKQVVNIPATTRMQLKIDKAGLKNLVAHHQQDSVDFVFDTGANISTVTVSTAKKLRMQLIPANIEVGTITGEKILADLAVCPSLYIGAIELKNVVFLVLPDEALYFQPIDYRINGIIGFPVMNAFKEIHITRDQYFFIPEKETVYTASSNMALDGLKPMIHINGMHFTFDSGADESMLYSKFYKAHREDIDGKYQPQDFSLGGAAGVKTFSGFSIPYTFTILDKKAHLDKVKVVKEPINDEENVYGNIGQDVINQFGVLILNFDKMFIKLN
ncbi:retropepsin-like aspartic protease [Niabella digestorum]|uniref:Retropepsin-like aspartic protease n=1 Tax=Niabella digestorum TaxID=3117701 RepID=A0ABU7RJ13_9BACT